MNGERVFFSLLSNRSVVVNYPCNVESRVNCAYWKQEEKNAVPLPKPFTHPKTNRETKPSKPKFPFIRQISEPKICISLLLHAMVCTRCAYCFCGSLLRNRHPWTKAGAIISHCTNTNLRAIERNKNMARVAKRRIIQNGEKRFRVWVTKFHRIAFAKVYFASEGSFRVHNDIACWRYDNGTLPTCRICQARLSTEGTRISLVCLCANCVKANNQQTDRYMLARRNCMAALDSLCAYSIVAVHIPCTHYPVRERTPPHQRHRWMHGQSEK